MKKLVQNVTLGLVILSLQGCAGVGMLGNLGIIGGTGYAANKGKQDRCARVASEAKAAGLSEADIDRKLRPQGC